MLVVLARLCMNHRLKQCLLFLLSTLSLTGLGHSITSIGSPAIAAEQIYFSYNILERSISLNALETYAMTGKMDESLAAYSHYVTPQEMAQLRQLLVARIPLSAVAVSQFLYSPIGEELLDRLGAIIQTDARQSGFYAIRGALILAAADPQGLTLLNILRKFPSQGVEIDLPRVLNLVSAVESAVNQTNEATALINQQSQLEAQSETLPPTQRSTHLNQSRQFSWRKQTLQLTDRSRDRTFPVDLYLPNLSTPRPVIVISHGLGGDRSSFAYLAQRFASDGFVVAVPEHPGSDAKQIQALTTGRSAQVISPKEFIDRPLDIKFLLDELNRLSQIELQIRGRLDLQHIGIVGQSFGGYTALALAGATLQLNHLKSVCQSLNTTLNASLFLQCLALRLPRSQYSFFDSRIKAAIAINPIDSGVFGKAGLSQIKTPILIVAGSADTVAPALSEQIQPFTWLTSPHKYLALIERGTHFSTIATPPDSSSAAIPVPEQAVGNYPELAQRYLQSLSVAFFETYLAKQSSDRAFLSAAYGNRLSQPELPLRLVRSLPASFEKKNP